MLRVCTKVVRARIIILECCGGGGGDEGRREREEGSRKRNEKKNIEECDKWALIIEMREICVRSFMETISNNQNEFVLINNNKSVLTSLY